MIKINVRICDQCHLKHRRCDRKSPNCSRCLKSNQKCTWDRPRVLRETANFSVESYFLGNSDNTEAHYVPRTRRKKNQAISASQSSATLNNETKLTLFFIKSPLNASSIYSTSELWKNIFDFWNRTTMKRRFFKTFLNSSNVSLENPHNQNFRMVDKIMNPQNLPHRKVNHLPLQLTFPDQDNIFLKKQAVKAYFYYLNPFFPLFTYSSFHQRPRSQFLKNVIICIGLRFLPRSDLRDQLIDNLEAKILIHQRLSNLTFNLDTLQTLLCIYTGLVWSSVESINYSLFLVAISITYSIGLHRGRYHKDPAVFLERSLAFYLTKYLSTRLFNEGSSSLNLEEMSNRKFSVYFSKNYSCDFLSKTDIHKPLDSSQLELCYLIITEKLHQTSNIFNETNKIVMTDQKGGFDLILKSEKMLLKLLKLGLRKTENLTYADSLAAKNNPSFVEKYSEEFYNPSLFQLVHIFRIRLLFDILRLFDLILITDSSKLDKQKLSDAYKRIAKYSTFIIKGLAYVNIEAPFVFYRPQMVLFSARMAIQASRHCYFESIDQIIDLSLKILYSQSNLVMYSYSGTLFKNVLEALRKNLSNHHTS